MKRNRKKITLAAMFCMLAALSAACQKQPEEEKRIDSGEIQSDEAQSGEASPEVSFEEQYDLGMRLLSEGKYEEAIIAFSVALEINPKSVDVYTAMADTYEAMGDAEAMRRILEQGIEATGDAGLQERLDKLPPQMPEIIQSGYSEREYVIVDEKLESIFADVIENGLAGNRDVLVDTEWNTQLAEQVGAYLEERRESSGEQVGLFSEREDKTNFRLWTLLSDSTLLKYSFSRMGQGLNFDISYRPLNGKGFQLRVTDYLAWDNAYYYCVFTQGEIEGWLYNGSFTNYHYHINYDGAVGSVSTYGTEQISGTAVNDLLEGERVTVTHTVSGRNGRESNYTKYENFEAGVRQITWTDEDGKGCDQMNVNEDGEVSYSKYSGNIDRPLRPSDT